MSALALKRHTTRTRVLGGTAVARESFNLGADIKAITLDDFRTTLRGLALGEVGGQVRAGNDQFTTTVDNRTAKPIQQAERKVVVVFGNKVGQLLMQQMRDELVRAIDAALKPASGRLRDPASWEWIYVPGNTKAAGQGAQRNSAEIASFGYADRLILRPTSAIPYVWFSNQAAKASGAHAVMWREKGAKRQVGTDGFMAAARRALMRRPDFRLFSVYVAFTQRFKPAGTRSRYGVPFFMVRLKIKGKL